MLIPWAGAKPDQIVDLRQAPDLIGCLDLSQHEDRAIGWIPHCIASLNLEFRICYLYHTKLYDYLLD
jgi:hypothetical protein